MSLADWTADILEVPSKTAPTAKIPLRDSFHTARGYRDLGITYSCIPDAVYPWDPEVMKRIREFAPDAVPMFIKWAFLEDASTENPQVRVFGRHALGRVLDKGRTELTPFRCSMPTMPIHGMHFKQPNSVWFVHDGAVDPAHRELPGNYLPFDDTILDRAKESARGFRMTDKEYTDFLTKTWVHDKLAARDKRRAGHQQDLLDRQHEVEAFARRMYSGISDVEWRDIQNRAKWGLPLQGD